MTLSFMPIVESPATTPGAVSPPHRATHHGDNHMPHPTTLEVADLLKLLTRTRIAQNQYFECRAKCKCDAAQELMKELDKKLLKMSLAAGLPHPILANNPNPETGEEKL